MKHSYPSPRWEKAELPEQALQEVAWLGQQQPCMQPALGLDSPYPALLPHATPSAPGAVLAPHSTAVGVPTILAQFIYHLIHCLVNKELAEL